MIKELPGPDLDPDALADFELAKVDAMPPEGVWFLKSKENGLYLTIGDNHVAFASARDAWAFIRAADVAAVPEFMPATKH